MSLFRAPLRGRGCAGAGGRIAAARLARLIARARRQTHLARRFPPGCFSRPQPSLSAEKPRGGPGSRLSLLLFYHTSPQVKPLQEQKMKLPETFHEMPTTGTEAAPFSDCTAFRPGPETVAPLPRSGAYRMHTSRFALYPARPPVWLHPTRRPGSGSGGDEWGHALRSHRKQMCACGRLGGGDKPGRR